MVGDRMADPMDRDRWAHAALAALERGGLRAVAVEPLARELGVTKGSFYWHFRSRRELIAAALERWTRDHVDAPLDAVATIADPRERLVALLARAGSKSPSIFIRLLDATDEPLVRATVAAAAEARVAFLARAFEDLGMPRAPARRQALLAYSAYVGRAHLERDAPGVLGDVDTLTRHIAEALIG